MYNTKHLEFIFDKSKQATIAISTKGKITAWNKAAEEIFGFSRGDILGKNFTVLFIDLKNLDSLIVDLNENSEFHSMMKLKTKESNILNVDFSIFLIIGEAGEPNGICFLMNDYTFVKGESNKNLFSFDKSGKRTFDELRDALLLCLGDKRITINQLATKTGINWKTVENHLTYLCGKGLVKEVFSSEYVRIFELTLDGKEKLKEIKHKHFARLAKINK